eukprot:1155277-Pelagomonas_calceolata.AAC.7
MSTTGWQVCVKPAAVVWRKLTTRVEHGSWTFTLACLHKGYKEKRSQSGRLTVPTPLFLAQVIATRSLGHALISAHYYGYSFCHPPHDGNTRNHVPTSAPHSALLPPNHRTSCHLHALPSLASVATPTVVHELAEPLPRSCASASQIPCWQHPIPGTPTLIQYHIKPCPTFLPQLIVVWNLHAREALDNANKGWLQFLGRKFKA